MWKREPKLWTIDRCVLKLTITVSTVLYVRIIEGFASEIGWTRVVTSDDSRLHDLPKYNCLHRW